MPSPQSLPLRFAPAAFQDALLRWYDGARRDLPWRAKPGEVSDPYHVWLSEVMLQQTTVKAVVPYFENFLSKWPTVQALAAAPRDEVLAAWAGLGYYSRARNLYACAKEIAQSGFPGTEEGLRRLPGIGAYTAAAIAAIAFGKPAAVADGNVERVLARVFALETPLPAAKRAIRELAANLTPQDRPGDYAQAMMDLGATVCAPRSPSCLVCPVRAFCAAAGQGDAERFPLKAVRAERPARRGRAFVLLRREAQGTSIVLRRREDKGLLGGMMEVPCTEWLAHRVAPETPAAWNGHDWKEAPAVRHTFTHFHLELQVFAASETDGSAAEKFKGEWASLSDLGKFALPTVMRKAVLAGLNALDIPPEEIQPWGKAARSASKVSNVETSARPSTKAGRK
jgi:A/G-specific adenine glycosylase